MRTDNWAMVHSLLSGTINVGLLHPLEVIEVVETAHHERAAVSKREAGDLEGICERADELQATVDDL